MGISKAIKNWLSTLSTSALPNDNTPPSPHSPAPIPNPLPTSSDAPTPLSVASLATALPPAQSPSSTSPSPISPPSPTSPTSLSNTPALAVRKRIHSHSTYYTAQDGSPPRIRTLSVTKPPKVGASPRYPRSRLSSKAERPRSWVPNQQRLSALFDHEKLLTDRLLEEASKTVETLSSEGMSAQEMFDCLIKHGCPDLTNKLDPSATSPFAVASGGYGDVWRGKLIDGTDIAIKVWRVQRAAEDKTKSLKKAMRELYNWSKTDHANIHKLTGAVMFHDRLGMVSSWMENGNLREYLKHNPAVDRYPLCVQVTKAVQYLHDHKDMVHGDLKASNFLVSTDGTAKLTDFDHSVVSDCTLVFSETTNRGGGTLRWMAPELVLETSYPNQRSKSTDVYALGMTILEIITGSLPYMSLCRDDRGMYSKLSQKVLPERTEHFRGARGEKIWQLLVRCWDHNPENRPKANEVLGSLESFARVESSTAS